MSDSPSISAIITGYDRETQLLETLNCISSCIPPPDEILVHIDGGKSSLANKVRLRFPEAQVLISETRIGPGGGRNKLISAARNNWIASFDDDSRPLDSDYFAVAHELATEHPKAAILAARVFLPNEAVPARDNQRIPTVDYVGCGCLMNRSVFARTSGYVELPLAYGMEEVDLALRLVDRQESLFHCSRLRVIHETDEAHHCRSDITAATITNIALHSVLRYPLILMPIGIAQCGTRILWLLTHGRAHGILDGLFSIPLQLWRHRAQRSPVSVKGFMTYRQIRSTHLQTVGITNVAHK